MSVYHSARSGGIIGISFYNVKKITLNYPKAAAMGFFSMGLKTECETAMVNKPSVLKPLKVHCIWFKK